MLKHDFRLRRVVWLAAMVALFSLVISILTGVAFLTVLKPIAGLIVVGMALWWAAFGMADHPPR